MMMRGVGGGMGMGSLHDGAPPRTSMMEKPEFQTSPWQVVKRLAPIVADHRRQVIIALVSVLAASSLQMLVPLSFKYTIDEVIPSGDLTLLWVIGGGLLVLEIVRYYPRLRPACRARNSRAATRLRDGEAALRARAAPVAALLRAARDGRDHLTGHQRRGRLAAVHKRGHRRLQQSACLPCWPMQC